MRAKKFLIAAISGAVAMLAFGVPMASATFHLMQIREVYPGSLANPKSEYVELQMWAAGQNLVATHVLHIYDAAGAETSRDVFPANVPSGVNQSTMLLATPEAEAQFGVKGDAAITAKGVPVAEGVLSPAGGAVCWETIDCVSLGNFSGTLASAAGSPAAAIPDGMALRRSIAPGCATLLEAGDDTNDSATDFAAVFPGPRPNSVAPAEHACDKPGVPSAPQTRLHRKPHKRSDDRTASFSFSSSVRGSSFECALDRHRFRRCRSPLTTKPLKLGSHVFKVRALSPSGAADRTPASYAFRVLPKR
jgi:hypothetical protein